MPAPGRRRVLYVNLDFPPMTWAGVWRALGFVKYLPRHGYDVAVLCGDLSPAWERYDASLLTQIPNENVSVRRLRGPFLGDFYRAIDRAKEGLPRGWRLSLLEGLRSLLQRCYPEPHLLWALRATVRALWMVCRERPEYVITSGPPHLTHAVGLVVKALRRTIWIADFRDLWMDDEYQGQSGPYQAFFRGLERAVLAHADALMTVSPRYRDFLEQKSREVGGWGRVALIPNGHDVDSSLLSPPSGRPGGGPVRIHFNGTIQARSRCYNLLEGLCLLGRQVPPEQMPRLTFPGVDPEFRWHIDALGLQDYVLDVGVLSHSESLRESLEADVLLVLVRNSGHAAKGVVTTKIFEAMALRRQILAVTPPESDLRRLLSTYPRSTCCDDDAQDICQALAKLVGLHESRRLYADAPPLSDEQIASHSRAARTKQLVALMESLSDRSFYWGAQLPDAPTVQGARRAS